MTEHDRLLELREELGLLPDEYFEALHSDANPPRIIVRTARRTIYRLKERVAALPGVIILQHSIGVSPGPHREDERVIIEEVIFTFRMSKLPPVGGSSKGL